MFRSVPVNINFRKNIAQIRPNSLVFLLKEQQNDEIFSYRGPFYLLLVAGFCELFDST